MEITVRVPPGPERVGVLGTAERNLKMIREALGVNIAARDGTVRVGGDRARVAVARTILERLAEAARDTDPLNRSEVLDLIAEQAARAQELEAAGVHTGGGRGTTTELGGHAWEGPMGVYAGGRPVRPKTDQQETYLDAIRTNELVFAIGPAGTGKTYLAVAAAVHMLKTGLVQKIVLARPAVEAGERLGFLPGDLQDKVNPYLRPLIDALHDMLDYPTIRRFTENDVIEISPLAFMRGRTLNNAMVILDEAQNTTRGQMKMFLTRLGHGSRAIITGDTTQIDLPDAAESGLIDAARRLRRVPGIGWVQLTGKDVVRHKLVQRIVEAYGESEQASPLAGALAEALEDDAADGERS
ncbi:MAG: PhoH family protein [Planctomycetota bacterium]